MANTENIEGKLCAYIDGDLDAAGRAEIEKHLTANPQHRGLIEQLSRQRDLLRELPRESAPEEILDALQSQMERSVLLGDVDAAAEAETMKIHRWPQLLAAAAIVILTVGLGAVIYFVLPRNANTGNYARVAEPGAALEAATASTQPGAADNVNNFGGAAEGRFADALAKSDAQDEVATAARAPTPTDEPLPAETLSPAPPAAAPDVFTRSDSAADVFAPASNTPGKREAAILTKDLVIDAQHRLHSADLARQLKDAPGGLQDNAMFVVVSTADPSAARSEVTNYLASNNIAWESVVHPLPAPLKVTADQDVELSRLQNLTVQMKQGPAEGNQPVTPPGEQQQEGEAKSEMAGGAAVGTDSGAPAPQSDDPRERRILSGVADAGSVTGPQPERMSNAIQPDLGLQQATTQTQPGVQQLAQGASPTARLIIARGMTKQQATELSSSLAKQTTVQRAAVYEQRPLPAASAARIGGSGGAAGATTVPAAAASPFVLAEELAAIPTTEPTTSPYSDEVQQSAIVAPTTQEAAAPTTTTAPAAMPLGLDEDASEERVDVVILVEDDVPPAAIFEQTDPPAAPQATEPPTTTPSTSDEPAPSTLPAPSVP